MKDAVRASAVFCLVTLVSVASAAGEQFVDGPPGAVGGVFGGRRPADPNRTSQSFDATFDLGGGYDSDPSAFVFGPIQDENLSRWFASTGSAAARYRAGSVNRSFRAHGRSYFNYQSNIRESFVGGEGGVSGMARFGRRRLNQLNLQLDAAYEPGWIFGAVGPAIGAISDEPLIGVAPPQGVLQQRWLVLSGTAAYEHHWNVRHATTLQYNHSRLRPLEGGGLEGSLQYASVDQRWSSRAGGLSLVAGYRIDENTQQDELLPAMPVRYQSLDAGLIFERRSSPSRRYAVTLRAGGTQLVGSSATDLDSLYPNVTALADFATSRYWSMSAGVRRGVSILAGVSAFPVVNQSIGLSFNGTPTRRLRYALYGSVTRADSVTADPTLENVTDVAGVTSEVRYAFSNWTALFASYAYYRHRIGDASLVASGFPPLFSRHSVRVGVSLWVPLYGAF